jgi:hypothetical protein
MVAKAIKVWFGNRIVVELLSLSQPPIPPAKARQDFLPNPTLKFSIFTWKN